MDKDFAKVLIDNGFNTIVTDKYLNRGTYDTFFNIISLSNTKSVISASISLNIFNIMNVAYIDNFFELLYM